MPPHPLADDTLEKKPELVTVDPVTLHDETDQGILYQLGERALGDVHDIPPGFTAPEI